MSSGKRFKFNGSSFGVQTGFAAGKVVTAITKADPAVVSSTAHGLVLGAVVKMDLIGGMTELEDTLVPIDNPITGSFELAGVDSTNYSTFVANSPNTSVALPVTFSEFCELTGVNQQDAGADQIEVSTICSTAKEFEQGLSDSGTLQLDFNWAGNEAVQTAIRAAKISGDKLAFKITFPGDGGMVILIGTVQQTSFQGGVNGVWTASATIKLSGEIYVLASA